jgi:hypothetical protein
MGERTRLRGSGSGTHSVWMDAAGRLVVEWYDFGPDSPYESANLILFDAAEQRALAAALRVEGALPETLAARFSTWFEVKAFAQDEGIPFESTVDFQP